MKVGLLVLSLFFATVGQAPAPAAPAAQKPIDAFQGNWAIASFNGQEIPAAAEMFLVFKGDKYEQWTGSTVDERGTIKLDVTKKPMWIDLIITEGQSAGQTQLGLYSIEGDTMNVTLANPGETTRPAALGQGEIVAVLKKAK
jgi:uncharacterized protein (TIGR03067 family)